MIILNLLFGYTLIFSITCIHAKPPELKLPSKKSVTQVLLIGQMRSGSSFTGELFNQHPEAFYMFEPLRSLLQANITDKQSLMRSVKGYPFVEGVSNIMKGILECDFSQISSNILKNDFMLRSRQTAEFYTCFRKNETSTKNFQKCLKLLTNKCEQSSLRVVKTIRMTTELAVTLLSTLPNLKIVYLVRDPRAIIQSRMMLNLVVEHNIQTESTELCNRMDKDMYFIEKSTMKNRIQIVRYEKFARHIVSEAKELFKFVDSDFHNDIVKWIEHNSVKSTNFNPYSTSQNSTESVGRWLTQIKRETAKKVDESCVNLYKVFGYTEFDDLIEK
ncbi:carbohydrate sulfotransferase 1-like [Mytilus galloprovincialis]|uniref:carbohydrate sulfotransferase 1-like n=1 Tax=Mytilus galloprovincialis TaxID=29158 RepID=UPI003F7B6D6C